MAPDAEIPAVTIHSPDVSEKHCHSFDARRPSLPSKLTFSFSSISTAPIPRLTLGRKPNPFLRLSQTYLLLFCRNFKFFLEKKKKNYCSNIPINTGEETYSTFLSFITLLKNFSFKFLPEFDVVPMILSL